ncbi:MAG: OsmC family peroxiredoxin [Actinobacteria bacterium]|nr:OsmC family peroxiredoxin [Actinomycetota bacterium]
MAERKANVVWEGDLAHGAGSVAVASGALAEFPVTWASRTVRSEGKTSPEELIAAAHASCYSMGLAHGLAEAGTPPERLEVSAVATLDATDAGLRITTMTLEVRGRVSGLDAAGFREAAEGARTGCPVSNALTGVNIVLAAALLEE